MSGPSLLAALAVFVSAAVAQDAPEPRHPNVLFVCVDDLRPQLGCDGLAWMTTPHLDHLAAEGLRFARHYVQVPTCGASRRALWTGRLPTARVDLDNGACEHLARVAATGGALPTTMPAWFRSHGYRTVSIGKISHAPDGRFDPDDKGPATPIPELPDAWDEVGCPVGRWGTAWNAFFGYADGSTRTVGRTPPFENADVDDAGYPDAAIADAAVTALRTLRDGEQPFFLAVGFFKPHLPFTAPATDLARYGDDVVGLAAHGTAPEGAPAAFALHASPELCRNYGGLPRDGELTETEARRVRRAYCAAVTYVDRQIGRVLDAVDALGLRDDTIVVVWGDHGWHLGDLGMWGKHTLFEAALHSVLITRNLPGVERAVADDVVESIDLFPTLVAACGLPPVAGLDGRDLAGTTATPQRARAAWLRGGALGRSVFDGAYRYTEWSKGDEIVARELYAFDPAGETANIADAHDEVVERLAPLLPPRGAQ